MQNTVTISRVELMDFIQGYKGKMFVYGSSHIFDCIAALAEKGIDADELARMLWTVSDIDIDDVDVLIACPLKARFLAYDMKPSYLSHPRLVANIVEASKWVAGIYRTFNKEDIVLLESGAHSEVDGEEDSVVFSVHGEAWFINFLNHTGGRSSGYDDEDEMRAWREAQAAGAGRE